ncbi:hypothetical protein ACMFMF_011848 [Clarireedia jacksonii]
MVPRVDEPVAEPVGEDFVPIDIPDRLQDDYLIKFLRIRFDEQDDYLAALENVRDTAEKEEQRRKMAIEVHRIRKELERIETLRSSFASTPENDNAMRRFDWYRDNWKLHARNKCAENLKNLDDRVLKMDLEIADRSRRVEWERRILHKVQRWSQGVISPKPKSPEEERKEQEDKEEAERKASQRKRERAKRFLGSLCEGKRPEDEENVHHKKKKKRTEPAKESRNRPEDSYGLTVSQITLRRSDPACTSSFMSYEMKKPSLNDCLFKKENNPLTEPCEDNAIRHFHIPANNMHWIEEAIARYYGEVTSKPPEYNYRKSDNYLEKSSNLLCREFWTSLQHGGTYDPVHARHMRAHCSRITPDKTCADGSSRNNFIVFMPYLHWESHKRRRKMSEEIQKITRKHLETQVHVTEDMKREFIKMSDQIRIQHARAMTFQNPDQPKSKGKEDEKEKKKPAKPLTPGPLGWYLLNIAKLYDAMDVEPDVRMLRDHLFQDLPLHTRRTLDQSYYWKLPNTDGRDQDQVVYRGTKEGKHISRTTRVVMVDQLWMYILDDNTIITSFPRRWGRNKPDSSGVHKGIRARLDHLRIGEVQSVYDLALLIMNQCSTVFSDLTKPVDERPEVLDIFSNALSHVVSFF